MNSKKRFTALVFTSADNQKVANDAKSTIQASMSIKKTFLINRDSPNLNTLQKDEAFDIPIDFIFNYLAPRKFPQWLINFPKFGCYNFHPGSYKYPGVGSASFALFNKDKKFGLTAHRMDNDFDSGDIVWEEFFDINPSWGCAELFDSALNQSQVLLEKTIDLLLQNQFPPKINNWLGKAVTRKEFVDWMTFELGKDDRDLDLLVKAISHPTFPGPFIRINDHLFSYQNSKGIE